MDKNLESNEYPTLVSGESWAYKYPQWKSYRAELFWTSFHEILVRETNLYAQQKAAVKPDQNESGIIFWLPRCWFSYKRRQNDELASTDIVK